MLLWEIIFSFILVIVNICVLCDDEDTSYSDNDPVAISDEARARHIKTRCTRRYSPGVCASHVNIVWTFVFNIQNCTERLGCVNYYRGNRFKTYDICMSQCEWLINMYRQMLEVDDSNNTTSNLRKGKAPKHNLNMAQGNLYDMKLRGLEDKGDMMNYEDGQNETHSLVYRDMFNNEYLVFPPDVDHVDGEIRSPYDLLSPRNDNYY